MVKQKRVQGDLLMEWTTYPIASKGEFFYGWGTTIHCKEVTVDLLKNQVLRLLALKV